MLKNYLKIAWRNLFKRKFYTLLNVFGLALGIICGLLIYLYINYQLSFDTYHKNTDHIFRLVNELHLDKTEYNKGSSVAMLRELQTGFPEVEKAALSINRQSFVIDVNGDAAKRFREESNISFTDPAWFKLFHYNWIDGSPDQLNQPNTAVITQKLARKYFGNSDPTGEMLSIVGEQIKIIGIISDPINTDLKADMYLSISSFPKLNPAAGSDYFTSWGYIMTTHDSFVYLKNAKQKEAIEKKLIQLTDKRMGKDAHKWYTFKLLPLKEMHFDTRYAGTQKSLLAVLALTGTLILIIAGINYINIVIAQQARRSAEIGTRKILGGSSAQLFMQFITESLVTSLIAVALSLCIVILILPSLNNSLFADEPVQILSFRHLYLFAFAVLLSVTLGAGIYPAYILSRMNIFQSLKNAAGNHLAGFSRKSLVVIQNVVGQVLIICTIILVMQVNFLKNTDKGFDRESVVMIPFEKASDSQREILSQNLKRIPGVQAFSFCYHAPGNDTRRGATIKFDTRDWEAWPASFAIGDSAYCKTFGIHIKSGRTISENAVIPEYLVNETMASRLYPNHQDDVIGKRLWAGDAKGVIVGITTDFNLKSMHSPIEPVILLEDTFLMNSLAVKLSGTQNSATLDMLKKKYESVFQDQLFTYQFVDEQIGQQYKKEILQQKFIWIATGIAIFISTLGLLGLISLITLQRTKEIGIRKVLGASVSQIISLLSAGFIKLMLLAFVIAAPIAWFIMNKWLQNFAYHIEIRWWMFVLAGLSAILIAVLTIGLQAVRAARANPVNSLRSE